MAGKIPEQFIQDLLARTDLVDLIDARIPLKRSGSNYMARCPFHNEKTPSFSVNRQKQFYYCFGCGARGTAISFLMDYDRLSFPEAIESLADALGLPVPREEGSDPERKQRADSLQRLYEIQEQAARYYQHQLKSHPAATKAVDYLRQRGVSGEVARRYRLGFAPGGARNLPPEWPQDLLSAAGLLAVKEPGRSHDWFRDRVMFPIRDRRGRVVGFGGRLMGDGVPKYLNSPETDIFRKHREVYGLFELLEAQRKPADILVVEGYMDVIALAQFGLTNAVATLGTATSTEQVGLLFKHAQSLIFCFDGDAAGQSAAWKALDSSLPHLREGRQIRFLMLPDGHDPDSLVRAEGVDAFRRRMEAAQAFSDYFFQHLQTGLNSATIEGRAALVNKAQPMIEKLPGGVFRDMIEHRLETLSGHHLATPNAGSGHRAQAKPENARSGGAAATRPSAMRTFLALLVQYPSLVEHLDSVSLAQLTATPRGGQLIAAVVEMLHRHPHITSSGLLELFRDRPEFDLLARLMAIHVPVSEATLDTTFLDHVHHLAGERSRKEDRLGRLIEKAGTSGQVSLTEQEREELRRLTGY